MTQNPDEGWQSLAEVTAKIINTYLANNHASVSADDLPKLVSGVRAALSPVLHEKKNSLKALADAAITKLTEDEAERLIIEEAERVATSRQEPEIIPPTRSQQPAVPIGTEITSDYIVCLEEGKRCKSMKGHLRAKHNLTPEQYRKKWGLPENYSMVPPNYSAVRRQISNQVWKSKKKDRP